MKKPYKEFIWQDRLVTGITFVLFLMVAPIAIPATMCYIKMTNKENGIVGGN